MGSPESLLSAANSRIMVPAHDVQVSRSCPVRATPCLNPCRRFTWKHTKHVQLFLSHHSVNETALPGFLFCCLCDICSMGVTVLRIPLLLLFFVFDFFFLFCFVIFFSIKVFFCLFWFFGGEGGLSFVNCSNSSVKEEVAILHHVSHWEAKGTKTTQAPFFCGCKYDGRW